MQSKTRLARALCIWLPNWPIQRVQAEEPTLANTPLVLTSRDPRRGLLITAANQPARASGIYPGSRLSEAHSLAPNLTVREHDLDDDISTLAELCEQAQQFSPIVGLEQLDRKRWANRSRHQPEALLLDVTGIGPVFGGESKLLTKVESWLSQNSYSGHAAIAGTVGAAWAAASFARRISERLTPPNSSNKAHTAGCGTVIIPPNEEQQLLCDLPLAALRIDSEIISILHRLDIRTIGDLNSLPRDGLATRLGEHLILRWDQAQGRVEEAITSLYGQPNWCEQTTLEHATERLETIHELMRQHTLNLSKELSKKDRGALRLICRIDFPNSTPLILQLGLFRPSADALHLSGLLIGQLEQLLRTVPLREVWRVSTQATLTAPLVWQQADLFQTDQLKHRQQIAMLVDTLSARLGRKQVTQARVQRDARPEDAFSFKPLTGTQKNGIAQDTLRKISTRHASSRAEPNASDPLRRPCHLFSPPRPIDVSGRWTPQVPDTNQAPHIAEAAAPARIKVQNSWLTVVEACGPERLESGWWNGPSQRRDYYRIETEHGDWYWIFRDLNQKQWLLHGKFD